MHARIIYRTVHRPYTARAAGDSLLLHGKTATGWRMLGKGRFHYNGMSSEGAIPDRMYQEWKRFEGATDEQDRRAFDILLRMSGIDPAGSAEQVTEEILGMLPIEQYRGTVIQLCGLPQLFIAV
ncbi:hypothetical protein ACF08E_10605 [Streptomyces globisporus]|uniref:hypothetical protein n=1 Tax=Streptomyces globisporus TaxID=1908 RepID=UPI0036FE79C1